VEGAIDFRIAESDILSSNKAQVKKRPVSKHANDCASLHIYHNELDGEGH
jgi:hypothetical protein